MKRGRRRRRRRPRRGTILWLPWVAASYLLGSVPFSYLAVRWLTGLDVRRFGSGNPGATNALRVGGPKAGLAALLGDAGKGAIATAVPRLLGAPRPVAAASAVAVTAGHVYPAFMGLKGGKGSATGFGALATLSPLAALGSLGVFSATVAKTRYVSLGSVVAAGSFPLLVAAGSLWRRGGRGDRSGPGRSGGVARGVGDVLGAAGAIAALVLTRHRGNLSRLRAGAERRLGDGGDGAGPAGGGEGSVDSDRSKTGDGRQAVETTGARTGS